MEISETGINPQIESRPPRSNIAIALGLVLFLVPLGATAYIGPGAGLGLIGSLIAVVAAVLLAIVGLFVLPFRLLRRCLAQKKSAQSEVGKDGSAEEEVEPLTGQAAVTISEPEPCSQSADETSSRKCGS